MRFSIKDPNDNKPLLLNVIPVQHEGQRALKVIFPERDSVTMIKKNNLWINAAETDISIDLVKAISQGIQLYIEPNKIHQPNNLKITVMKNILFIQLLMTGITLPGCNSDKTSKDKAAVIADSSRTDTSANPGGGLADTTTLKPDSLQIDTL